MAENSIVNVIITILSVIVVAANVTICLLVVANKSLQTYTNGFLVSLAVSDILLGAVLFPVFLTIPESATSGYIVSVILLSGVTNHCCITFDRLIAIRYPFSYSYLIQKYFTKVLLTAWVVAVVFSLIPLCWKADSRLLIHKVYIFVEIVIFIFVPYMLMFVAYCLIFATLREHFKIVQEMTVSTSRREQAKRLSSEAKVAKVCLILIATFVLCWLPIIYMTSATALGRPDIVPVLLPNISIFTLGLSSLINPALYTFKKEDFRTAVRKIFRRNMNAQIHPISLKNHIEITQKGNTTHDTALQLRNPTTGV